MVLDDAEKNTNDWKCQWEAFMNRVFSWSANDYRLIVNKQLLEGQDFIEVTNAMQTCGWLLPFFSTLAHRCLRRVLSGKGTVAVVSNAKKTVFSFVPDTGAQQDVCRQFALQ